MTSPTSEADLAAIIVGRQCEKGYDVHQEVQLERDRPCADVVAIKRGHVIVTETKQSLSTVLIRQGCYWRDFAHEVWLAVPAPKTRGGWEEREKMRLVFDACGLGLVHLGPVTGEEGLVHPFHLAQVRETPARIREMREFLKGHRQDMGTAGAAQSKGESSGKDSPFQRTARALKDYVADNPGCMLKHAVKAIEHHWGSNSQAIGRLRSLVEDGAVKGVRYDVEGGILRLFPEGEA